MSRAFAKPVIVVSKCLEFEACRYNGERISSSFIERLEPHVRFRPVCPEVEIDLGTPRDPIRIYLQGESKSLYQPGTRKHLTQDMNAFSGQFLGALKEVDGFILKVEIPVLRDYGRQDIPRSRIDRPHRPGVGPVRRELRSRLFSARAFVDETGLNYRQVRAGFLTKIFALAGFREVKKARKYAARLVRYHAENKLLFMAYHRETMREMGRIAANHENRAKSARSPPHTKSALLRLLAHPPARASWVNALAHAMGHFSEKTGREEKSRFLDMVDTNTRSGKNPAGRAARNPAGMDGAPGLP